MVELLGVFAHFEDAALMLAVLIILILTFFLRTVTNNLIELTKRNLEVSVEQATSNAKLVAAVEQQNRILEALRNR